MRKKIEAILMLLSICCLFFTSCSINEKEINDVVNDLKLKVYQINSNNSYYYDNTNFSPNGEWLIDNIQISDNPDTPYSFKAYSLANNNQSLLPDKEVGIVNDAFWASDSLAFVSNGYERGGYCADINRAVIFEIDLEELVLSTHSFIFEHSGCTLISWSPDNSKIAIHVDPDLIYILSRNGELLSTYEYLLPSGVSNQMFWGSKGLYFIHQDSIGNWGGTTEINLVNLQDGSSQNLRTEKNNKLRLVGISNDSDLMVLQDIYDSCLWIYDLESMVKIGTFEYPGDVISMYFPEKVGEIAISSAGINDPDLYILDIQSGQLTKYGSEVRIDGWEIIYQGYLIINISEVDNNFWGPIKSIYRN